MNSQTSVFEAQTNGRESKRRSQSDHIVAVFFAHLGNNNKKKKRNCTGARVKSVVEHSLQFYITLVCSVEVVGVRALHPSKPTANSLSRRLCWQRVTSCVRNKRNV